MRPRREVARDSEPPDAEIGRRMLLEGGAVSPWRALKAMCKQPSLLPEFCRLARDTKRASRQLGLALGELLTLTLSN